MPRARKVLIADDEPHIRKVLTLKLKGAGFDVTAVANAQAVLEIFGQLGPDLLITDFRMPGEMTGMDLIGRIRALPEGLDTPIILLTGSVAVPDKLRQQLGANSGVTILSKPFSPRGLMDVIRNLLGD